MKNLIIIGAGNFGREVFTWAKQCKEYGNEWIIKGFLDDRINVLDNYKGYEKIIGTVNEYVPGADDVFICALGEPEVKIKYSTFILDKGGKFINLIHPTVVMGMNVELSKGIIICPNVSISSDIKIGNYVTVNMNSTIGHDSVIEDWCQINANCGINGWSHLGQGVFMGGNSVTLPKVIVGEFGVIGAGSVVLKKVNAYTTVFGNPAKPVGIREKLTV